MDTLAIDRALAPQERPGSSVAVARVGVGERFELAQQFVIGGWAGLVEERCALELNQHARPQHG